LSAEFPLVFGSGKFVLAICNRSTASGEAERGVSRPYRQIDRVDSYSASRRRYCVADADLN